MHITKTKASARLRLITLVINFLLLYSDILITRIVYHILRVKAIANAKPADIFRIDFYSRLKLRKFRAIMVVNGTQ